MRVTYRLLLLEYFKGSWKTATGTVARLIASVIAVPIAALLTAQGIRGYVRIWFPTVSDNMITVSCGLLGIIVVFIFIFLFFTPLRLFKEARIELEALKNSPDRIQPDLKIEDLREHFRKTNNDKWANADWHYIETELFRLAWEGRVAVFGFLGDDYMFSVEHGGQYFAMTIPPPVFQGADIKFESDRASHLYTMNSAPEWDNYIHRNKHWYKISVNSEQIDKNFI